jgi:hypothetical protein
MKVVILAALCTGMPLPHEKYDWYSFLLGGPGSSVGIATDYGLDGPGIESVAASVV